MIIYVLLLKSVDATMYVLTLARSMNIAYDTTNYLVSLVGVCSMIGVKSYSRRRRNKMMMMMMLSFHHYRMIEAVELVIILATMLFLDMHYEEGSKSSNE